MSKGTHDAVVGTTSPPVSERAAAWGLFVLFTAYALSFVDRTILSLLIEPIKRDLGLSDTQISLLQGLAFSFVYTVSAIPIAMIADHRSRRTVIAIGITFWSVATAVCGLAGNFFHLFIARMGVGAGEASLSPSAYSMIADMYPEHKRGRALAIYGAGLKIGSGLAMLVGGVVVGYAATVDHVNTPFGPLHGWQLVFMIVALPGLLVAAMALTIKEPPRHAVATLKETEADSAFIPFMRAYPKAVICLLLGFGASATTIVTVTSWAPSYYIRVHGYTAAEIGSTLGLILLIPGTLGAFAGGAFSDWMSKRGHPDATLRTGLIGLSLSLLFGPLSTLVSSATLSLTLLTLSISFASFCASTGPASVQRLAPGRLRARSSAVFMLLVTLLTGTFGPISVGLLTDYVFGDASSIGWSMAIVTLVGDLFSIILLLFCLRPFRAALLDQASRLPPA